MQSMSQVFYVTSVSAGSYCYQLFHCCLLGSTHICQQTSPTRADNREPVLNPIPLLTQHCSGCTMQSFGRGQQGVEMHPF